jgi:transcriptional regulator with XRE-family HTH domain
MPGMDDWRRLLVEARRSVGVSRQQLAELASLSADTLKSYELGPRRPSRGRLTAVLDALKIERKTRNAILAAAGFVPDGMTMLPGEPRGGFSHAEAATLIDTLRWPAFVLDEFVTVVAANEVAQRLWGVDLRTEYADPIDRNLLSVASDPRFADRCLNWDEAISTVMSVFKRKEWGHIEELEDPSPIFAAVLERFLAGRPEYVARLSRVWEKTPSTRWDRKMRWSYPVVWKDPAEGTVRFECTVTVASHADSTNFNDWIPVDAQSWETLERIRR